ncbi:MAG: peptide chain release factor N(5)-glutamine methyltransferase, partial [Acidobacteriaceae bacterium]
WPNNMTIKELLNFGAKRLKSKSTSPQLDSEVLLSFVLNKPKSFLFANPKLSPTKRSVSKFLSALERRALGEPVAYLTGAKEFMGMKFKVSKSVLIPRPETESMVEELIRTLHGQKNLMILDIGTGSGCIIIALAKNLPGNTFFASDITKASLAVARKNGKAAGTKIIFKQGSLLAPWKQKSFDVIIANLPYLPAVASAKAGGWKAWKNNTSTATSGLKFEPKEALFTGENGLQLIESLLSQLSNRSKTRLVVLEFDPRQALKIKKLANKYLPTNKITLFKDLYGKLRFALIEINK